MDLPLASVSPARAPGGAPSPIPSALTELQAYAAAQPGSDAARQAFVLGYFASADPDEVTARGPAILYAMALAHWRLLSAAPRPDGARVRVYNPTLAEDGYASDHTVLQIVHDDMPFLVDSVTMAVNRGGRTAHWIVHPLMALTRGADGRVQRADAVGAAAHAAGAAVASLIMVECDRIVSASDRERLAAELARVLGDVRATVEDWPAMLQRLGAVCHTSASAPIAAAAREEGIAFLRWLEDRHFTFLGARDYALRHVEGAVQLEALAGTGLGILRGAPATAQAPLAIEAVAHLQDDELVRVTKAMTRATVHRPSWLDYVGVKRFDDSGALVGETRFLGLYTSTAYAAGVERIPLVRQRVAHVLRAAQVVPESHAAKALQSILEDYPRDELFQVDTATLTAHALGILRLQERQRTRLFLRRDPFGRFSSAQVFVPRERYNTELRVRVGHELMNALDGQSIEFTPTLTDSPMARIHYLVRARGQAPVQVPLEALELRIARMAQRWQDECTAELLRAHGEGLGLVLANRFANAFPTAYREDFAPAVAAEDADVLAGLTPQAPLAVRLYRPLDAEPGMLRFKIFHTRKVALSDSLPVLEHMGARVLDEHPYPIATGGELAGAATLWIHDLGLQVPADAALAEIGPRFEALFAQAWRGEVESDDLNRLVLTTALDARAIVVLRAYTRYFRQIGFAFSQAYIEATLNRHATLAEDILRLFEARFDPAREEGAREAAQQALRARIEAGLASVSSLDDDRILRQFHAAVLATARTNLWQRTADGRPKPCLSFKLKPRKMPGVPDPKPMAEIWVYSPRVEGLHLRFGKVARGGLRWSDRREDFRTEILGLVKAQQVKNTVIVPVGSKGGFVPKNPPPAHESPGRPKIHGAPSGGLPNGRVGGDAYREAWMAEGVTCYRIFLCGLLDVTDNIVKGTVVPPAQVVRHDEDDPYLVVAADKGTATFSDIANAVSADYGFWLGDAFASGGSQGYDHKKMGITARGAWESAKRHFRGRGLNIQTTDFTVAGIGDMSGDVFGNGMLLSEHIRLVAAFDHRHVFIDPAPDAARSFAERRRLFALPRSSWDDYDKTLISEGGGVWPRSAKAIALSPQARAALGTEATELTPNELLHVILQAPVDMLYNGGIGTYVKAAFESHAQAGDKASDAFRVDGRALRCKVLVEGGNLGATQHGRIEYAQSGGRGYTDAIDNSAGVDCSDHEVNIKILLGQVVESGDLTLKQRNEVLASMTDEVGLQVLTDNYYQSQALEVAQHRPLYLLDGQQRLMQWLEQAGKLNRAIEFLPDDAEIARRRAARAGLTRPEGAVLMAYAKMSAFDELLASDLPDDPYFERALVAYFPQLLSQRFASAIASHPLKREIIATSLANSVINRAGATFVNFIAAEAGATAADVVRAFTLAREVFALEALWDQIDALDYRVQATLQLDLLTKLTAIAQRASRWILRTRAERSGDLPSQIARYQPAARELRGALATLLPAAGREEWREATQALVSGGVEPALAEDLTALEYIFPALDLVELAQQAGCTLAQAARTYFDLDAELGLSQWRAEINRLPTDTLWQTQARGSARDDVYSIAVQITLGVLARQEEVDGWRQRHAGAIERLRTLRASIATQAADLAPVSVALRALRQLA